MKARAYQDQLTLAWSVYYYAEVESPLAAAAGVPAFAVFVCDFGADRERAEAFAESINEQHGGAVMLPATPTDALLDGYNVEFQGARPARAAQDY